MKKKTLFATVLCLPILLFTRCTKEKGNTPEPAETSYSRLSWPARKSVQDQLIRTLNKDPDYIQYNLEIGNSAKYWAERDHLKDTKAPLRKFRSVNDAIEYYKSRGLRDPEKYVKSMALRIRFILILHQKYPQLNEMDLADKNRIFKLAEPSELKMKGLEVARAYQSQTVKL